jgi:type IV pilus assembly protein PilB
VAERHGLPFVELGRRALDPDAVRTVPLELLERIGAIPFALADGVLHVALGEPSSEAAAELGRASGHAVALAVAPPEEVEGVLRELARGGTLTADELRLEDGAADGAPAVRAANEILRRAAADRASDIHLVPDHGYVHVRFRIDGVVREHALLPPEEAAAVIARLKVLGQLDVAERRKPQDGRFTIRTTAGRELDLRVTVLPTISGEGIVLRLLEKTRHAPSLTELGLENAMQMDLERLVARSVGALVVTGPTGSGKSTTLYAALADLARPDRTLITIEDPVEYELPGAYQLQVSTTAGVTFASALRAVLRGDPDVIMVGEMRDAETARIALGASLAGHFLLTTLHTGDAPTAVSRLVEMGVERYVVGAGLAAVLGQRLARRLCLYCREPYVPRDGAIEPLRARGGIVPDEPAFFRPTGCAHCSGGYHGRTGIFQLLVVDDELRSLVAEGAPQEQVLRAATAAGMRPLWADGVEKAAAGLTSLEELHRVLP